jgi:hypothetical protein
VKSKRDFNESALKAKLRNGSIISLKGASNPDSLRGVGIHFMVIDEFADVKDWVWKEVLRPMLSDTGGHALFTGTPKGYNFAYELWLKGQKGTATYDPNWASWQFTTLEGGNVSAEEVEEAQRELDERTFRQEYMANFETYSGVVYYAFDRVKNVMEFKPPDEFQKVPLHVGMDFNVNPIVATVAVENSLYSHVFDEVVIYSSNTNEISEEIRNRYPDNPITIYPDPACRQRRTSAGGNTDLKILQDRQYGFRVKVRDRHPLVRDRINSVNSRFCTMAGERRLFIDPKCRQLTKCVTNQLYKENTMIPDKDSGFDHMNDALGYYIEYLYPIRRGSIGAFSPTG